MTYRAIDISDERGCDMPDQAAPLLQWVKIADLVVDDAYQRSLNGRSWSSIRKIAAAFNWAHFGAVSVAPIEGGRFALIDGQHRSHAAALCGIEAVPAIVNILPVADQARAFAMMNSSAIRVTQLQVYRAALASGEHWAVACCDAVAAGGCELKTSNYSSQQRKIGWVFAVQLIRKMVEAGQAPIIQAGLPSLRIAAEAMGPLSGPLLFRDDVLRPWFTALAARPEFVHADLEGFLRRNRLMNLLENAARLRDRPEFARTPVATLKRDALVASLSDYLQQEQAA